MASKLIFPSNLLWSWWTNMFGPVSSIIEQLKSNHVFLLNVLNNLFEVSV